MESAKMKILIIENEPVQFEKIVETIERQLGDYFDIFPKMNGKKGTPENFDYFIEEIIEMGDSDKLLEFYNDIDLFIIDIMLKDDNSVDGLELEKKIKHKHANDQSKTLIISSRDDRALKNLLWKGTTDFYSELIKKIIFLYPVIDYKDKKGKRLTYLDSLAANTKRFGKTNTAVVLFNDFGRRWRQIIHMCITIIFYLLIMVTTWYGFISIWGEFFPTSEKLPKPEVNAMKLADTTGNLSDTQLLNDIDHKRKVEETMILEHAEKIFLYLLPIFIVFGFYIYYNSNIKVYFYDGKILPEDQQASVKSMNLTKSIFVSSIISFTVIKVIDELFFNTKPDRFVLYCSGVLLLILMGYFILLNQHNSDDHAKKN